MTKLFAVVNGNILEDLGENVSPTYTRIHYLLNGLKQFSDINLSSVSYRLVEKRDILYRVYNNIQKTLAVIKTFWILLKNRPYVYFAYPHSLTTLQNRAIFHLCEVLGLYIILDIHDTMEQANVLGTGKPLFSSDLERKYIQKASLVIALNQYMWNYLKYKYQIWNKKVVFIPNAYENEFCNLYASAYKSVVNRFNICYVGGLTKNRGIELIVKVCKKLHEKYPYLKLYLFGSYGEAISSELKETIENSEFIIRKQIRRKDLPSSLLEMDLLIMPYDPRNDYMNFSSPTKLFEYIGTCKPILCTKCKSLLDIGETGGIMYIDYDESDIKNKIELLILNPQLREKLSNELMNIRLHHTWQERAKVLHNALASLDKCHE